MADFKLIEWKTLNYWRPACLAMNDSMDSNADAQLSSNRDSADKVSS